MAESKRSSYQPEKDQAKPIIRKTYLFVIGIDQYQHLRPLQNAVTDAKSVAKMLTDHFDCEIPEFAPPLLNKDATRTSLTRQFKALSQHFKQQAFRDNLLIYFAGHGEWDDDFEAGYWALHSAREGDLSTYFSNADLVQAIKAIRSHHTLIISDSCFSGGLIETARRRSNRKESNRSRYVLASGLKDETVSDGAPGTQSPFAASIVDFLEIQKGKSFNIRQLEIHIEAHFKQNKLKQEPIFAPLSIPENKDGELWLYPRFDEVTELDRLLEMGDFAQVDAFITDNVSRLRKKKKITYAREKLEELAWENAKVVNQPEVYLTYLARFLLAKSVNPQNAIVSIRNWIELQRGVLEDYEEDLNHLTVKNEKLREKHNLTSFHLGEKDIEIRKLTKTQSQLMELENKFSQQNVLIEKLIEDNNKIKLRFDVQKKELEEVRIEYINLKKEEQRYLTQKSTLQKYDLELRNILRERDEIRTKLDNSQLENIELKEIIQKSNSLETRFQENEIVEIKDINAYDKKTKSEEFILDSIIAEFVNIEGGVFMMGEKVEVTLDSFCIAKFQVTQKQWMIIMGENPSHFIGPNLPVECISWNDCHEFIGKLNQKTGLVFRLPTEAEWEYTAGGGSEDRTIWAGTNEKEELSNYAWYKANSGAKTHPIGTKTPNTLGVFDMSGNVWEWCSDFFRAYPLAPESSSIKLDGRLRVARGGSWGFSPRGLGCQVRYRIGFDPSVRDFALGFRLALDIV